MNPIALLLALPAAAQLCPDGVSRVPAGMPCPRYVFFDSGKSDIRREWEAVLDVAAADARAGARLRVTGHSDAPGSAAINRRMARARAEAVAKGLIERGVAAGAVMLEAAGEDELLVPTVDGVREIQNRRVAITTLP